MIIYKCRTNYNYLQAYLQNVPAHNINKVIKHAKFKSLGLK